MLETIAVLLNRLFFHQKSVLVWLTKQISLRVLLKVMKSVKSHISFGVRNNEIS